MNLLVTKLTLYDHNKNTQTIQILHDEINDRVQDCLYDSFIIFPFDTEFWCFYKSDKLNKIGSFESLESAVRYVSQLLQD